jgi:uncharacterized OsmC-like protein
MVFSSHQFYPKMNIHFEDAQRFVVSQLEDDAFNVSGEKPIFELTALATFVLSLARCTYAVLWVYGGRSDADPESIEMTMSWEFDHEPTRFKQIAMDIYWPTLAVKKQKVAQKMAAHCTIHNTIHNCVEMNTTLRVE